MKRIVVFLLLAFCACPTFSQDELVGQEKELVFLYETMNSLTSLGKPEYLDVVGELNGYFINVIEEMTQSEQGMEYEFTELKKRGINISVSGDKLLRVITWAVPGGTQHNYNSVIQYRQDMGTTPYFTLLESAGTSYEYDTIYVIRAKSRPVYVLSGTTNLSTTIIGQHLLAFSIEDGFSVENIFKNSKGERSNELAMFFDIGCSDLPDGEFPRPVIDEESGSMLIPAVELECLTGEVIRYRFDNGSFNRVK